MLGSTIHSCHTLLTHSYIMSYIVIHCHAMTYIVRKSLLRSNGIWFHTMLFWTLQCCAPPSIKYSVWLMCACTVSWYVCHTLYRWIWYLYGRIGRVDGCGINTAHYPVFGRWKPWVGLIYRSDGQKGYNPPTLSPSSTGLMAIHRARCFQTSKLTQNIHFRLCLCVILGGVYTHRQMAQNKMGTFTKIASFTVF